MIQAALLHDTVEDTETTLDEIEEHFGQTVRKVVAEVTDDDRASLDCTRITNLSKPVVGDSSLLTSSVP